MAIAKLTKGALVVAILAALGLAVWKWSDWRASAQAASAYAARITCSCRFVEGRGAESCVQDVREFGGFVSIGEKPEEKAISGTVPLLGKATARFEPGFGCLMRP